MFQLKDQHYGGSQQTKASLCLTNLTPSTAELSLSVTVWLCVCVSRGGGGKRGVVPCYLPHKGPSAQPTACVRWGLAVHLPSALLPMHTGYLTSSLLQVLHQPSCFFPLMLQLLTDSHVTAHDIYIHADAHSLKNNIWNVQQQVSDLWTFSTWTITCNK